MSDTIIVAAPEPEVVPEPEPEVVPESEPAAEVAAATADAVGDAVAETVAAIEMADAVDDSRFDELNRRIESLTVTVESLAQVIATTATQEPEPEPVVIDETVIEDDEIVPNRRHWWFRPLGEIRGEA